MIRHYFAVCIANHAEPHPSVCMQLEAAGRTVPRPKFSLFEVKGLRTSEAETDVLMKTVRRWQQSSMQSVSLELDLTGCHFPDPSVIPALMLSLLCPIAPKSPGGLLQHCILVDCGLDDSVLGPLISAIRSIDTVETLDISENIVGSDTAALLHEWVCSSNRLSRLVLDGSQLSDAGCVAIFSGVTGARHLRTVSVRRCGIGARGGAALMHLISALPSLLHFHTEYNAVPFDVVSSIDRAARSNRESFNKELVSVVAIALAGALGAEGFWMADDVQGAISYSRILTTALLPAGVECNLDSLQRDVARIGVNLAPETSASGMVNAVSLLSRVVPMVRRKNDDQSQSIEVGSSALSGTLRPVVVDAADSWDYSPGCSRPEMELSLIDALDVRAIAFPAGSTLASTVNSVIPQTKAEHLRETSLLPQAPVNPSSGCDSAPVVSSLSVLLADSSSLPATPTIEHSSLAVTSQVNLSSSRKISRAKSPPFLDAGIAILRQLADKESYVSRESRDFVFLATQSRNDIKFDAGSSVAASAAWHSSLRSGPMLKSSAATPASRQPRSRSPARQKQPGVGFSEGFVLDFPVSARTFKLYGAAAASSGPSEQTATSASATPDAVRASASDSSSSLQQREAGTPSAARFVFHTETDAAASGTATPNDSRPATPPAGQGSAHLPLHTDPPPLGCPPFSHRAWLRREVPHIQPPFFPARARDAAAAAAAAMPTYPAPPPQVPHAHSRRLLPVRSPPASTQLQPVDAARQRRPTASPAPAFSASADTGMRAHSAPRWDADSGAALPPPRLQ